MEKRNVTLHVRVSDDAADELKKLAAADGRTVSGYISRLLDKHLAEQKAEKPEKRGRKS
jgi:predicted DNA-binding protein